MSQGAVVPHSQGAQAWITQCNLQLHKCLLLPRKHSPDGTSPDWGCGHLIAAYFSFIYTERMKGWVGLVGGKFTGQRPTFYHCTTTNNHYQHTLGHYRNCCSNGQCEFEWSCVIAKLSTTQSVVCPLCNCWAPCKDQIAWSCFEFFDTFNVCWYFALFIVFNLFVWYNLPVLKVLWYTN